MNRIRILHSISAGILTSVPPTISDHGAEIIVFYACNLLKHCFFRYEPQGDIILAMALRGSVRYMCTVPHPIPRWVHAVAQFIVAAVTIVIDTMIVGSDARAVLINRVLGGDSASHIFSVVAQYCKEDTAAHNRYIYMASILNATPYAIIAALGDLHATANQAVSAFFAPNATRHTRHIAMCVVAQWAQANTPIPANSVQPVLAIAIAASILCMDDTLAWTRICAAIEATTHIPPTAYNAIVRDLCYSACAIRAIGVSPSLRPFNTSRNAQLRALQTHIINSISKENAICPGKAHF